MAVDIDEPGRFADVEAVLAGGGYYALASSRHGLNKQIGPWGIECGFRKN